MYDLALALGEWDIDALEQMPLRRLVEWQAYHQLNPFGETRADWRAGMIAATMVNLSPYVRVRNKKPKDFMPEFRPRERMTPKQMYESIKMSLRLWRGR